MFHFSYQRHPPNVADKLCTYLDHEALKSAIVQVRNQSLIGGIMKFMGQFPTLTKLTTVTSNFTGWSTLGIIKIK